jgi:DNA-binding response OmpR family regulator
MSEHGSVPYRWPGEILLVDDDPRFTHILRELLELNGFTVITASTGEQALEHLALSSPKVVLLDVRMPGMDGLLILKHIRVNQPNLPVIIITQDSEDRTREEAAILGANGYLLKPFDFEQLKTLLLLKVFT